MEALEQQIKQIIIESLRLEDLTPADIDSQAPLFNDGLGLDSIDALELGVELQKRFNLTISVETGEAREHFATVANLARFIAANRK